MPTKNCFSSKPWNWTTGRPHEGTGCASCRSPLENMKSSCGNLKGCLVNMPLNQATDHQVEFGCFTATICQQSFMVRIDRDKWWSTSSIANQVCFNLSRVWRCHLESGFRRSWSAWWHCRQIKDDWMTRVGCWLQFYKYFFLIQPNDETQYLI